MARAQKGAWQFHCNVAVISTMFFTPNMWNTSSIHSPELSTNSFAVWLAVFCWHYLPSSPLCERGAVPGGLAYRCHHRQREGLWCLRMEQTNEEFCVLMTALKWNGLENQSDSFSDYCVTQLLQSPWGPRQQPSHRKCRRKASEIELLWTKARSCCCAFQMERLYYE